mmetsp:Transcript_1663/g.3573  ORF Transcript_1663/g.3573 Transcript_1663/m.3573 type:complete len:257 (-) Transcript_1663:121-891(-)
MKKPQRARTPLQSLNAGATVQEPKLSAFCPDPNYISYQPDLKPIMRSVTWDWLVRVHWKFDLHQRTLFLTANYLDRYLSRVQTSRHRLQLAGVTAMFVASKYEEVFVPESADFIYMTDRAYSKGDLFAMERDMLRELDYRLSVPTQLDFLMEMAQEANANQHSILLATYLLELSILELDYLHHPPDLQAAAALFLALKILCRNQTWSVKSFSLSELRPLAKHYLLQFRTAGHKELRASFSKFAQPRFWGVSLTEII